MIELYQFSPLWGLPNASPFCLKLETYFKMASVPYEVVRFNNTRKAPKGKLPFIKHNDKVIADSNVILTYVKENFGNTLDSHLDTQQASLMHCARRMIDEHLYWVGVYSRWVDENNWPETKKEFFGRLKLPYRWFIPDLARKNLCNQVYQQGIGRHNQADIYRMGAEDLAALSNILADKPYFMGEKPTTLDATAFGILVNLFWVPMITPLKDTAKTHPNLKAFCDRIKTEYYSDWRWPEACN